MKHRKRRKGSAERFLSVLLSAVLALTLMPENVMALAAYAQESATEEPVGEDTAGEPAEESTVAESAGGGTKDNPTEENTEGTPTDEETTAEESGEKEFEEEGSIEESEKESTAEENTEGTPTDGGTAEEGSEKEPEGESPTEESEEVGAGEKPTEDGTEEESIPEESTDAEEGLCPHHEQHTEDCGYGEDTPCGYECKICPVQKLIDALPDAEEITAENAADVEKQLAEIDGAKAELTDEELDALDTTKYEAAVSALLVLEDMEGANRIQALADSTVAESDTIWENGTYTVTGNITLANRVEVKGIVTLVLNAGCKLTANKGIAVTAGNSLTIEGEGTLEAKGGNGQAGIGGNYQSETGGATGGIIRITGGTITATGGVGAAGIGGGNNNDGSSPANGGTIEISGGTVKATGNRGGAGIGGGLGGSSAVGGAGGTITISGNAHVEAIGDFGGAGIGGGSSSSQNGGDGGTIMISGNAHVEATGNSGGAGIGGGKGSTGGAGGEIEISGGTVTATGGSAGTGIGGGYGGSAGTIQIGGGAHVKAIGGSSGGVGVGGNGGEITIDGDGTYVEAIGVSSSAGIGGYNIGKAEITVTIHGGEVKATGGDSGGAGIGSGGSATGPVEVTISGGTVTATGGSSSRSGGAGIGSGGLATGTVEVTIHGGTIAATGGGSTDNLSGGGAGIGSGGKSTGTATVTIGGGTVTATGGGSTGSLGGGGAGIGAGGRSGSATFSTGENGSAWIVAMGGSSSSGQGVGIGDNGDTSGWSGIIFQNGAGQVYGRNYTLTANAVIPSGTLTVPENTTLAIEQGATLTNGGTITNSGGTITIQRGGSITGGTITGTGTFQTENLTADDIVAPTGWVYNGKNQTEEIKTALVGQGLTATICGQAFQVTGWDGPEVSTSDNFSYTITYTLTSGEAVSKTVKLGQSGTQFVDTGAVKTYNDDTETTEFAYGETITVKAAPTATGQAPVTARSRSRTLAAPTEGQMAVYYGSEQVSDAASFHADGQYTMTVSVKDLIDAGAQYNQETTLTAKFVGTDYMADGTGTVNVTLKPAELAITGAALAAKTYDTTTDGTVTDVHFSGVVTGERLTMGENGDYTATAVYNTADAGTGNRTATVTVMLINGNYAFADGKKEAAYTLNGQTISTKEVAGTVAVAGQYEYNNGAAIIPAADQVTVTYTDDKGKEVTIPSSEYTFTCTNNTKVGIATLTLSDAEGGNYKVSGEGSFRITKPSLNDAEIILSQTSYTYDGTEKEPAVTVRKGSATVDAGEYDISYSNANGISGDHTNAGTITVTVTAKESGNYFGSNSSAKFIINPAPLPEVTLSKDSVTYNGNEQKPMITVGNLTENTDYEVGYTRNGAATTDFTNAGEIRITVTCKGNYEGTAVKTYTIKQAVPVIAWNSPSQELAYTGKAAVITAPTVTLAGNDAFSGTITYSDAESGASYTVLPTEVGTYKIKAGIAATENYTAAMTEDALTLSIQYWDKEKITVKFTANGEELTETAWVSPATQVTVSADGCTIAAVAEGAARPAADEIKEQDVTMSAQEVAGKTFYFKQDGTGHMTDGIRYELNIDGNPPGGSIELKYKFWDKFLSVISFGRYQAQDKTVTIQANDKESGIRATQFVIVTEGTSYATKEALEGADLSWQAYDSNRKPTVVANTQSVIYAKLTDKVGNVTYISSEGIFLDTEAPVINDFNTVAGSVKDVQAQVSITVDETAAIYLVAVPTEVSVTVRAEDVVFTCDEDAIGAAGGDNISGAAWHGILAADGGNLTGIKDITGLAPFTTYTVYAVAVDKVIDMDKTANDSDPVYTGNVSDVSDCEFETAKEEIRGRLTIFGDAVYGQQLKAQAAIDASIKNPGGILYRWYRVKDGTETLIGGAESDTYTLTEEDIGCTVRAVATASRCSGNMAADTGIVQKADCPAGNNPSGGQINDEKGTDTFTFTGKAGVTYEYSLDGGSSWTEISTDGNGAGTVIVGNIALAAGKVQIRAKETDVYKAGEILPNGEPFTAALEGSVSLTGTAVYKGTLTAEASGTQEGAVLAYSFYQSGKDEPLQAGSGSIYVLKAEDIGKTVYVEVTAAGYTEGLRSGATDIIRKAPQTLTVPAVSYTKTYGGSGFRLGCTTDGDGQILYTVSGSKNAAGEIVADTDIITVSGDGTVTIKKAGTATVTATLEEGVCYAGTASKDISITVNKKTVPDIPEISKSYIYSKDFGEETVSIAGSLPKDRGDTGYTLGSYDTDIVESAAVDADGNLKYKVSAAVAAGDSTSLMVTVQSDNYRDVTVTVNIGIEQSGTVVSVQTEADKSEYAYGETVTVTATAEATGKAPAFLMAAPNGLAAPAAGQMAAYYGNTQVSEPVAEAGGRYTMTVPVKALVNAGAQYGQEIMLTAKFVRTANMAGASGTVAVTLKPATLTITGATLAAKAYDKGKSATVTGVDFSGLLAGDILSPGTDYTTTAAYDTADAGTGKSATVTVRLLCSNYIFADGAKEADYGLTGQAVSAKNVEAPVIELPGGSIVYDGTAKEPAVTVKDGNDIIPGSEYRVAYTNNINVGGTATVAVEDKAGGNYIIGNASKTFTITAASVGSAEVTVNGTYTYNGTAQTPGGDDVTVMLDGKRLKEGENYTLAYGNNVNAGAATVTVAGRGNYSGSASAQFTVRPASLSGAAVAFTSGTGEYYYTAKALEPGITVTLNGTVLAEDTEYSVTYGNNTEAGTATISVTGKGNYTGTAGRTFTIKYYDGRIPARFNGKELTEALWFSPADVIISADGFTIAAMPDGSFPLAGDFKESIAISAREVGRQTFYFKQDNTGYMTDGNKYMLNIDDTPPTGRIRMKNKWWENALSFVSFGHYRANDKTVSVEAQDSGSGIKSSGIQYAVVTGSTQYTTVAEVKEAGVEWVEYDSGSKPTVTAGTGTVIYAKLTDNVGNIAYISSDGILLDETAPTVSGFKMEEKSVKDVQAQASITVDETAAVYLVAVPKAEADKITVDAKDVIATCDANAIGAADGSPIAEAIVAWSGTLAADGGNLTGTKDITGLIPNTTYTVYAVAVDKVIDLDNTTDYGKPVYTGNVSVVSSTTFTTKKSLPVITRNPEVSGTYGQTIGEMLTPGTAQDKGGAALTGTWAVSGTDRDKTPPAGTTEEVTVIFRPDKEGYDGISVTVTPEVNARSLLAEGVAVSQVAGNYTYTGSEIRPPVAAGAGTPAAGIQISDSRAALAAGDFTVSYGNNTDAGTNTAVVTITGQRNYTGSVTRYFTIGKAPGRTVPGLTGTKALGKDTYTYTITPIEGAAYRMGDDGTWTAAGQKDGNVFTGIKPGTEVTFYAKIPGDANHLDGAAKGITVTFEKLTQAVPPLSYTYKEDAGTGEITVTIGKVTGAEYSFDGGSTWGEANEQGGFGRPQTVALAIRMKGTDTHNPSRPQTVKVNLTKEDREAPGPFTLKYEANGETDYTVTIPPTEGCEYSFDGVAWSDNNVKAGVAAGETVTGYKRYKETDMYNASSAVYDTETMRKFTVKTPVVSPAGGAYTGSVSVSLTCGTPGAEIYYTTDGNTPTGSSKHYTGTFIVTPAATVKAIAIKEGFTDSAIATAKYTKKGSGSSGGPGSPGGGNSGDSGNSPGGGNGGDSGNSPGGGNSGDSGNGPGSGQGAGSNNGGSGQGTGGGNGGGNPASAAPANSPTAGTDPNPGAGTTPGTGTVPAKPGKGNTAKPGSKTGPGNSAVQEATDAEKPFLKGGDGKTGWDVIRAEEEKAEDGNTIDVDMNGAKVVPGDIFDSIRGREITITFDMDNGILWSVDGKGITADQAGDIDFSVKTGVSAVPVEIVNNVTGGGYSIQLSLAHEGEFGFTAVLSINLGRENAGYTASLYHYNEDTAELELICKDIITEDGTASLAFTHASDYVIAIDKEEEAGGVTESAQPEEAGGSAGETPEAGENPEAGKTLAAAQGKKSLWAIVAGIIALAAAAFAGVLAWRKKGGKEEER